MTNKLVERLEEITAQFTELTNEAKVIVHQLRAPSTITQEEIDKAEWQRGEVEGVIEFEGQQYKKVDRKAREGDVVIFEKENIHYKSNKPYLVEAGVLFRDEDGDCQDVYNQLNRAVKYVNVYELIEQPKSANQQRAEIITKAKNFLEEKKVTRYQSGNRYEVYINRKTLNWVNAEFIVNAEKRTVVCLVRWTKDKSLDGRGIAKCMPTDVFNADIGKAIALGRALGLDVSEFENVVQPDDVVEGMILELDKRKLVASDKEYIFGKTCQLGSYFAEEGKIINDTNAEYEVLNNG